MIAHAQRSDSGGILEVIRSASTILAMPFNAGAHVNIDAAAADVIAAITSPTTCIGKIRSSCCNVLHPPGSGVMFGIHAAAVQRRQLAIGPEKF